MNNIPLSLTGLYDPVQFENSKCTINEFNMPFPINNSIYLGKVGKNQFLDHLRFYFDLKQNKTFDFHICENRIGFIKIKSIFFLRIFFFRKSFNKISWFRNKSV